MPNCPNADGVVRVDTLSPRSPELWSEESFYEWTQTMGLSMPFQPEDIQSFLAYTLQLQGNAEHNPFKHALDFPLHPRMALI
ncbi:hypothetical protein [Vampirovibrio sp.]|uniref:hypothetical protein n=1 Tax=Vampirovibrio sp. TaxID=2717857 RepID=UPI003593252F